MNQPEPDRFKSVRTWLSRESHVSQVTATAGGIVSDAWPASPQGGIESLTGDARKPNVTHYAHNREIETGGPMTITPEIKKLCSRIALERCRPAMRQTAIEMRRDAERVIASGEPIEGVQAWLTGLLGAALQDQARDRTQT